MHKHSVIEFKKNNDNELIYEIREGNDEYISLSLDILRGNKIYSPMFDNTFDNMSDVECKTQLDNWVIIPERLERLKKIDNFEPLEDNKHRKENYRKFIGKRRRK